MNILVISNQLSSNPEKIINPVVNNTVNAIREYGVTITKFPVSVDKHGFYAYIILFFTLLKLRFQRKGQYDVVQVHFGGIQALIVNIFYRKNVVVSFHGTDLHGGTFTTFLSRLKSGVNVIASRLSALISGKVTVVSPNLIEFLPRKAKAKCSVVHGYSRTIQGFNYPSPLYIRSS